MPLTACTDALHGAADATPSLDDVVARLRAIDGRSSHAVMFRPRMRVRPLGHLQGILRLPFEHVPPTFLVSKHDRMEAARAGLFVVRYPGSRSRGEALAQEKTPGGPGLGFSSSLLRPHLSEHPGGLGNAGFLVAVAHDPNLSVPASVQLLDARAPEDETRMHRLVLDAARTGETVTGVSAVGLLRLADGGHLLAAYRYSESDPERVRLFLFDVQRTASGSVGFSLLHTFRGSSSLPSTWRQDAQNLALLGQRDGSIFLAALRGRGVDNHVDLYALAPDGRQLTHVYTKSLRTLPGRATLRAGGSLYVTPTGALVAYAVQGAGGGRLRDMMIEEFSP